MTQGLVWKWPVFSFNLTKSQLSSLSVEDEVIGWAEVKCQRHCDLICWLYRSSALLCERSMSQNFELRCHPLRVLLFCWWSLLYYVYQSHTRDTSPYTSKTTRRGCNSSFPAVMLLWLPVCLTLLDICVLSYIICLMFILQVWKTEQPGDNDVI